MNTGGLVFLRRSHLQTMIRNQATCSVMYNYLPNLYTYKNFISEATFSGLHVSLVYTVSQTATSLTKTTPKVLLNLLHSLILVCYYDESNAECDTSCEEGKSRLYKPQFQALILLRISLQIYTRAGFKENCTTLLMKLM